MSSFWMVIMVLGVIALIAAALLFILFILCGYREGMIAVVILLMFGLLFGAGALSEETTKEQKVEFTITHMDVVRNKYTTDYKVSIKSEDGSLSKVMDVTEEEYAALQVGDTLTYDVTWYKNNVGEEGYHIKPTTN